MNVDFEFILFVAVVVTGFIALVDYLFFAAKRKRRTNGQADMALPMLVDYSRSFFPILLLVFLFRSFLFEPFRIPTGSLEPTLLIGDFIVVNKYRYGLRLPVLHNKMLPINEPKRGDIITFRYPVDPSVNYIKRVIGLPGDHISYINKELYINGEKIPQTDVANKHAPRDKLEKRENLLGIKHLIYIDENKWSDEMRDVVVPDRQYFVMGDNRDDSLDSRFWGFVPEENIVGQAILVWLSIDWDHYRVRWKRIGKWII